MEKPFLFRKEKLADFRNWRNKKISGDVKEAPEGLMRACGSCGELMESAKFVANFHVCLKCGHYEVLDAHTRLRMWCDPGTFDEWDKALVGNDPLAFPDYRDKLAQNRTKTQLSEAVVCGSANILNHACVLCVMDNRFLMASMGSAVGEKITRAIERATRKRLPIIICATSGGARMQEGIYSLMQMAKTSAALAKHHEKGLLFISFLTHPTTGGVTASFASLGDIILAEPHALIGFAGQRVIESTIRQTLPEGFQSAEFQLKHGFVDAIVTRNAQRKTLGSLLSMHGGLK
jgi:acetyl-CoA carboxylase carboxyl transferase subunit beta